MVQIIPQAPSFGQEFARALGGGLSQGLGNASDYAQKLGLEKSKQQQKTQLLQSILGGISPSDGNTNEEGSQLQRDGASSGKKGVENLSDQQILQAELTQHGLGTLLESQKKEARKKFSEDRAFETEKAKPFTTNIESLRERMPYKESAMRLMEDAIESGGEGISWDYLAKLTGYEPLLSQEGAKLIAGTKEFLLGNIGRGGSRPNMWLEQQIASMAPQLGRKKSANLAVLAGIKNDVKLEQEKVRITDAITDQYEKEFGRGFVPGDIGKQVDKLMRPIIDKENDKLAYQIRQIQEMDQSDLSMAKLTSVKAGTPLTKRKADFIFNATPSKAKDGRLKTDEEREEDAMKIAKKLGYKIYDNDIWESFQ